MPLAPARSLTTVFLATLALLIVATPSAAGTLEGLVFTADGLPLAAARIHVVSAANGITIEARTDDAGLYRLTGLPDGIDYVLQVADDSGAHATMVQDRIVVRPAAVARESFRLFPSILELVRVRAGQEGRLVDLGQVGTRTRYSGEFLAGLPVTCSY
jgi:hypothetical protein